MNPFELTPERMRLLACRLEYRKALTRACQFKIGSDERRALQSHLDNLHHAEMAAFHIWLDSLPEAKAKRVSYRKTEESAPPEQHQTKSRSSSRAEQVAHTPPVAGSSPASATKVKRRKKKATRKGVRK